MTNISLYHETKLIDPKILVPHEKNAAKHPDSQIRSLANAYKKFGFVGSVFIGSENKIIAGHGRVLAAVLAGMPEIPCTDLSHLSDDEQSAYMIADNKIAEQKLWDDDLLKLEIERLTALNFNLGDLGFIDDIVSDYSFDGPESKEQIGSERHDSIDDDSDDETDIDSREERYEAAEREDDIDEKPEPLDAPIPFEVPARVTPGSAWRLGRHLLVCGNSSDGSTVHKFIGEETAHSIVTDPPYGISFMGKEWDHGVPSSELWKVWFSRITPGAHILSFCATRMYHHMAMNIENAGFEPRDMISWMYGSGMPKSMNISKAIDKEAGAKREVIGTREVVDMRGGNFIREGGIKKFDMDILGDAVTPSAKQWDGYGTGLKPANEPIMLARKPHTEPTIAKNVQRYGTGGLNIDGSRVGSQAKSFKDNREEKTNEVYGKFGVADYDGSKGRWPANVILSHADGCVEVGVKTVKGTGTKVQKETKDIGGGIALGKYVRQAGSTWEGTGDEDGNETVEDWQCVEDCPVRILDEQSGQSKSGKTGKGSATSIGGNGAYSGASDQVEKIGHNDAGGASRFFYVPKPSRSDKSEGNNHATVKPIRLMQYLIKLITPQGGTVLEPFAGSGTTLLAAERENFRCVAFELDAHHCDIILHRWQTMTGREAVPYTSESIFK